MYSGYAHFYRDIITVVADKHVMIRLNTVYCRDRSLDIDCNVIKLRNSETQKFIQQGSNPGFTTISFELFRQCLHVND